MRDPDLLLRAGSQTRDFTFCDAALSSGAFVDYSLQRVMVSIRAKWGDLRLR